MGNRYGRKQKRAHRALVADLERRANEMSLNFQRLIREREGKIRERDESLRLLGAGYGLHVLEQAVSRASGEFMKNAMAELGRNGIAAMRVSCRTQPFAAMMARDAKIVTVHIPHAEFHAVVEQNNAR